RGSPAALRSGRTAALRRTPRQRRRPSARPARRAGTRPCRAGHRPARSPRGGRSPTSGRASPSSAVPGFWSSSGRGRGRGWSSWGHHYDWPRLLMDLLIAISQGLGLAVAAGFVAAPPVAFGATAAYYGLDSG